MYRTLASVFGVTVALVSACPAAVITVTTADSSNPGNGKSLLMALQEAAAGDTIAFNIPGDGPHYLVTPDGGYPRITQNNLTLDGYTQPGASPNTNPIHAPNNAKIKIVLDSRNHAHTPMNYGTGRPGYGDDETAILGVFNATGVTIKGFSFLGARILGSDSSAEDPNIYCVAFARDYTGDPTFDDDGHVAGCWFGVEPDGTSVTGGSAAGIAFFRHRDVSGGPGPELPNRRLVVGVAPRSANPRAEFNVFVDMDYGLAGEAIDTRVSGNFFNVLPDGITPWDYTNPDNAAHYSAALEIGRYSDASILIGTDGDGANDDQEGNVFGSAPTGGPVLSFYGQNNKKYVVAGNYFGVGVNGVTRFPGSYVIVDSIGKDSSFRLGSDFDGVSDAVEANLIVNNSPWDPNSPPSVIVETPPNGNNDAHGLGKFSVRGNILINNFPIPVNVGNFAQAQKAYTSYLTDETIIQPVITRADSERLEGTTPVPVTDPNVLPVPFVATIIDLYLADPEGIQNGGPLGLDGLPNGFVQGRKYLGSFVDNGPDDKDPAAGSFSFDVSKLHLGGGNYTITANYTTAAPGTHDAATSTSPFSEPVFVSFVPGGLETTSSTRITPDSILFDVDGAKNLDNWEPYGSVIGTDTFVVEANSFADGSTSDQRFRVAFAKATGGAPVESEGFYGDDGSPYIGKINASRQNGNPGRVAGDRRPCATDYVVGGEVSLHIPDLSGVFGSDGRWDLGWDRLANGRWAGVQSFSLDTDTLVQAPLEKAFDAINGRLTSGAAPDPQIGRFGGDLAFLDNGNIVVAVHDKSKAHNPAGDVTTAVIVTRKGQIVKEAWVIDPRDIWSNVASYQGGFAVRVHDSIYFHNNAGDLIAKANIGVAGVGFDTGRGDGSRIAAHINSPYVFHVGGGAGNKVVYLAAWDSRNGNFMGITQVSEPGMAPALDRATAAVDALNRVAVAYEARPTPDFTQNQTLVKVLSFDPSSSSFKDLTPSFFPFVNNSSASPAGSTIRTIRPTIAMTTKAIMVAAKGEINRSNDPSKPTDTQSQTTFLTVIGHPLPQDDPTPPAPAKLSVLREGSNVILTWPACAASLRLESNNSLDNANGWTEVRGATSGILIPATGAPKYFRLHQP
jgi:hypothetical protein